MLRYILAALGVVILAGAVIWFTVSPLTIFNTIVPKDSGSERVARISTGESERQGFDIYAPVDASAGDNLPVIVFFHGGGWRDGAHQHYAWAGRALAAQGVVAVMAGYRLTPEVEWPAFQEDGVAAVRGVRRAVAQYGGDPDRLFLAGHSAGAQIAALLALDENWLGEDRAAVAGWIGVSGPYDFLPLDSPRTIAAFSNADPLEATQPLVFAGEGDPPALLLHGSTDDTVNPRKSVDMAAKLEAAGVSVTHIVYDGVGHINIITALARWGRDSAPTLRDMAAFARDTR
ncbi:MAG: alpha/beta hydrolase [Sphingomonadaceae bacterium]|nr:alpha/beta hydrolase [Sphingomonadaceae bacterium]